MSVQNNELFQGKQSLPVLPTLSFLEAGFSEEVSVHVLPAVSVWLFSRENLFENASSRTALVGRSVELPPFYGGVSPSRWQQFIQRGNT
jgi:hypothetical protein